MELDPRIKKYRDTVLDKLNKENKEFTEFMDAHIDKHSKVEILKDKLKNMKNQYEYEKGTLKDDNEKLKKKLQDFKNIKNWNDFQSKMDKLVL